MTLEGPDFQSTHPTAPASGWTGPEAWLTIVHPPELAGQTIVLRPDLTLGRSPEPGVTSIFHGTISRRHAVVRTGLGDVLCLHDLSSKNGSKLNGKRPELPTPLKLQTVVRLGDVLGVVDEPSSVGFDANPVLPGASACIARVREQLSRAAADPAPVLIFGETGTGKERLAAEVHRLSGRQGPYHALNCAELSPQLIESQLFGHERGAFTGASNSKPGLFAAAHTGTLFLDEIGELPADLQPKLLRVLQEGEVRPVGSIQPRKVDVRIVLATNRDLVEMVNLGQFRRDLYARLSLWELRLPPLRERRRDILPWVEWLCAAWNRERGTSAELRFTPDAAERILLHSWLDNLRGLNRLVHRLASVEGSGPLGLRALSRAMPELFEGSPLPEEIERTPAPRKIDTPMPSALSTAPPAPYVGQAASTVQPGADSVDPPSDPNHERLGLGVRPTREELLRVYEVTGRSVRATSKHFGRDRRQIYRWLESFKIPRERESD